MRPADLLRDAVRGIRLHRLRSRLTAASFAAGTAAAVSLAAITGGARLEVLRRIQALGADLIAVREVGQAKPGSPPALTLGDAEALGVTLGFVREAAPVRWLESSVLLPDERVTVRVVGTTRDYFRLRRLRFERGRPFPQAGETAEGVCVLGAAVARRLFPYGGAYGSLVKVGGNWYRVVGVLAGEPAVAESGGADIEGAGREIYLPISSSLHGDIPAARQRLQEIWMRVDEGIDPQTAASIVERALVRRHEGTEHFEVATAEQLLRQQRAARGLLDWLLAIVAVAALALGAVAMTSVSWQAVAERRREIAIRRAIGATREEILAQFVLEGVVLAAVGSLAGVAIGALGSGAAAALGGWPLLLSARAIGSTLLIGVGIGLLASSVPAWRAATLDPVTALRFDR